MFNIFGFRNKTIAYDVQSAPYGISIETLTQIKNMTNFVFWDSSLGGVEPKQVNGSKLKFTFDTSIPKNRKLLDKLMKELDDKDADTTQSIE